MQKSYSDTPDLPAINRHLSLHTVESHSFDFLFKKSTSQYLRFQHQKLIPILLSAALVVWSWLAPVCTPRHSGVVYWEYTVCELGLTNKSYLDVTYITEVVLSLKTRTLN